MVGPTGMGKTVLASVAASGRVAKGGRVVAVAHRRELVDQMAAKLAACGLEVGVGGLGASAPVQVTSIQTMLARRELPDGDFLIVDEAHHYVSDEWIQVPRAYLARGALLFGLTATPVRDDGRGLGGEDGIFDELVVVAQTKELVELNAREPDKGITPITVYAPETSVRKLAQAPHEALARYAPNGHAVVFAPNVKTAHVFSQGFASVGIEAPVVIGDLDTADREGALTRFARGDVRVVVNVAVLTEGWDAPICDTVVLGRKIGSLAFYNQCVGRGRRARLGKTGARLIDLSGNVEIHGHPDEELEYSLEGAGMSQRGACAIRSRICPSCRRVLDLDIVAAKERGEELTHCPECKKKLSTIRVPTPEEVELARIEKEEARRRTPDDKRAKALVTLFAKGLRAGHEKRAAIIVFQRMFGQRPHGAMSAAAWREAVELVARERGDAWEAKEGSDAEVDVA